MKRFLWFVFIFCFLMGMVGSYLFKSFFYSFYQDKKRQFVFENFISDIDYFIKLIGKRGENNLVKLLEFGKKELFLAKPVSEKKNSGYYFDYFSSEEKTEKKGIAFIPVLEEDKGVWKLFYESKKVIFFFPAKKGDLMIILKGDAEVSKVWKMSIFVHELTRLICYLSSIKSEDEEDKKGLEKYFAFRNQFAFLEIIGGEEYQDLVKKAAREIKEGLKEGLIKIPRIQEENSREYFDSLNKVFGKSFSEQEEEVRWTTFWLNAIFVFWDSFKEGEELIPSFS